MSVHKIFFMSHDELLKYGQQEFSIDLSEIASKDIILSKLVYLIEHEAWREPGYKLRKPPATHIRNRLTGKVFSWTDELKKYLGSNGFNCDENGNEV